MSARQLQGQAKGQPQGQPPLLFLLSLVQMGKFFSHYGMRALLVLYMVNQLKFSDSHAFGVNALFCGLVELGGIVGGILADRYLGLRRALLLGGTFLALGYLSFLFEKGLFFSLALVVLGGTLFASNITALLGSAYQENDPRRKNGFTIFYMMQNLGALFSTLLCAFLATRYGFRCGFLVASLGMVIALLVLLVRKQKIERVATRNALSVFPLLLLLLGGAFVSLSYEEIVLPLLPAITIALFCFFAIKLLRDPQLAQEKVKQLLVYLGGLILFFAAEDQICSSLILFAERETSRIFFGWTIPSSLLMSVNPIVIILFGTTVARLHLPFLTPFLLVTVAFKALAMLTFFNFGVSFGGVIGLVVLVSLAELMVGPVVSSMASEVATKGKEGIIMGMVPMAFSLAFLLGGGFSKMVAQDEHVPSSIAYGLGFGKIALILFLGALLLQLLKRRFGNEKCTVS